MKNVLLISSMNSISPANYLLRSLKSLGSEVFLVTDVKHPEANLVRRGSIDVSRIVSELNLQPDFLLFVEGGEMGLFPVNFLELSFPKYWWGIDTHNDYKKHLRISRLFDHSFLGQKNFVESLHKDGIKSASWLPLAYPESEVKLSSRSFDVSYIGSMNWNLYPERGELLSAIQRSQPNCFVGTTNPSRMFEIYEQSKIVFNYSPKNDLNMRIFESMGSGALLITNKIINNGLDDFFVEGEDFLTYSDSDDLISKLHQFLANPAELNRLAMSGMNKVRSEHTYGHRAATILDFQPSVHAVTDVDCGDFALVLVSMGLYSDSLSSFFCNLEKTSSGKRNRLILKLCGPLMTTLVLSVRLIEFIARRTRKRI